MTQRKGAWGWIIHLLVIVGGLNWGLVGLGGLFNGDWNVVSWILGSWPVVENIVYLLVGIATVITLFSCKSCGTCGRGNDSSSGGNMGGSQPPM